MSLPGQPGAGAAGPGSAGWNPRLAALFVGLAAAGLITGIVAGRITGSSDQNASVRPSQPISTGLPSVAATTTAPPSPIPVVTTPKPAPTATKAAPPDYSPIPPDAAGHQRGLDCGFLTGVQKNGDLVTLCFDRASYYTGDEAVRHNGGKAPDDDYVVENNNPAIRTFTVQSRAPLIGVSRLLSDHSGAVRQQKLDASSFVANATAALRSGQGIAVWVRHTQDADGPVTSLAEQYIP